MNDTLQLVIVLIIIALAVVGLVRQLWFKAGATPRACRDCPVKDSCVKKSRRKDCCG